MDESNKQVIQLLKLKIDQGIYSLDQPIVPQQFEKTLLRNGKVTTEEVSILRRKFPLTEIHKDLLASDQEFSKFTKEEVIEKLLETAELNESEELLSL